MKRPTRGRPKGSRGQKRVLSAPPEKLKTALKAKLKTDDNGCWVYEGTKTSTGHATFYFDGKVQGSAHRVAYELWVGTIPPKHYVLQTCNNKVCCNPAHLRLATLSEVIRLRDEAGKSIAGERNPKAKLAPEQVLEIRRRAQAGERLRVLAEEFGVSQPTVSQIKHGLLWGNV